MDNQTESKLTILRTEIEPCRIKLDVEVPADRVNRVLKEAVGLFRKSARIPGFRSGKTPPELLAKRYGKEIQEEARERLLEQATKEACEQLQIVPETNPRVDNHDALHVAEGQSFCFAVTLDVAPTFDMPEYKGLTLSREQISVDDQSVQNVIDSWLRQKATYEKVDRAAQANDLLKVSYHAQVRGVEQNPTDAAAFLLNAEETWVAMRPPEIIPGTMQALMGSAAGETRNAAIEFPADYAERSLAGRTADYVFKVLEVQTAIIPAFTDQMAKEVGAENTDQVRQRVRQGIEADRRRQQDDHVRNQLVAALMDKLTFPLPPGVLARESYQMLARLFEHELQTGKTEADLQNRQKELGEQAQKLARQRLKRYYVLRRIADAENIQVDAPEIDEALVAMSRANRTAPKVLQRQLTESGRITDVVIGIRENKTVNHLMSLAHVTEAAAKQE
ncbi:MAG: trigger factor [Lentisphaerae bacterium RIFOXYB12_FULL_65_16]|nr:MAG: trigger factor [Lentisphaerae bacterium RIFOXYA12_64_32]OGV89290.1 MAG: trigger factor [Lentisphaerae bacterium RIFOXYB12_FULL_65_16]